GGLIDAFREIVDRYPDHPADIHNGLTMSYSELDAAARDMALRLGPEPGVIAVRTSRSPETIVSMLGIWSAGGTYCPIDPAFPDERPRAMRLAAGCGEPSVPEDAYILFTSGSTGDPKPVLTPHRAIEATVRSLRDLFGLSPEDRVLQFAS